MSESDYTFLEANKLSPSAAANLLGVSRQAVYAGISRQSDYFDEKRKTELAKSTGLTLGFPQNLGQGANENALQPQGVHRHFSLSIARSLDVLQQQQEFNLVFRGDPSAWTAYCVVMAERDSAEAVASVLRQAVDHQQRALQSPVCAMVLKSNIAWVAPSISLQSSDGLHWKSKSSTSVYQHEREDANYCGALILTLAACGLTFHSSTGPRISFTRRSHVKFDGLYLDPIFDSRDTGTSCDEKLEQRQT